MPNGTDEAAVTVPWRELERVNAHRTSAPTDDLVRRLVGELQSRRGRKPLIDAVFLAALELAAPDIAAGDIATGDVERLMSKVTEIEGRRFPGARE